VKRFKNFVMLAYILPGVAFIFFGDFESAEKRFRPEVFDRAWFVYFFFGIFGLPLLLFGPPSMASIKASIQSDRFQRGVKRKLQTTAASIGVVAGMAVTYALIPPRNSLSAAIDISVFLLLFGTLMWVHFRAKSD
jgi:hypothetical protein